MSSETNGQLVTFTCDECGATFEIAGRWKEPWESAKEDGWRAFKDESDDWQHRCPECRGS